MGTCNAKFHPGLHEGVDVRMDDFLRTKISWMQTLPNFLTIGAPLCTLHARKSSAVKTQKNSWSSKMATQISSAILLNISDIAYTIHVDGEYC